MRIGDKLVDEIIKGLKVEYNGCHAPHNSTPLYGRAAYWRIYLLDGTFIAKITTKVKVMRPNAKTLSKLFRAELKRRIEAIGPVCETDNYGQVVVYDQDPYCVGRVLDIIENKFIERVA